MRAGALGRKIFILTYTKVIHLSAPSSYFALGKTGNQKKNAEDRLIYIEIFTRKELSTWFTDIRSHIESEKNENSCLNEFLQ